MVEIAFGLGLLVLGVAVLGVALKLGAGLLHGLVALLLLPLHLLGALVGLLGALISVPAALLAVPVALLAVPLVLLAVGLVVVIVLLSVFGALAGALALPLMPFALAVLLVVGLCRRLAPRQP